jgi:hypothetical protein
MMGMRMPETCWAVSKRQVINLRSCCILLVDSVEYTKHCRSYHNFTDYLTILQLHRLVLNGKMKSGRLWKQFWHILIYLCRETENKHIKTAGNHANLVAANPFLEMVFTLLLNVSGTISNDRGSGCLWHTSVPHKHCLTIPYLSVHMKQLYPHQIIFVPF